MPYAGDLQFYVLFVNPSRINAKFIYVDYSQPSSGDVTSPPLILSIYSDSSSCSGYQIFFIGLAEFKSYGKLGFSLSTDSIDVNLTITHFNVISLYKFNSVKLCSTALSCDNVSFPFLWINDGLCYDICPTGYYGNNTSFSC
jgi:hypothetical protein